MGHVRDRWTDPIPESKKRKRNGRWGKGRRWQARWIGPDGREHVKACATQDEAELLVATALTNPDEVLKPATPDAPTFAVYAQAWLPRQVHWAKGTRDSATQRVNVHLIPALGEQPLNLITRPMISDTVSDLAQSLAPSTVRVVYSYLTAIMSSAVEDGHIEISPCRKIKLPPKPRKKPYLLTTKQVGQIRAAMTPAARSMVVVGAATGLRPGELRALTWDKISADGTITVEQQLDDEGEWAPTKTKSGVRQVPMGASAWTVLKKERPKNGEGLVWTTRTGRMVTRRAMGERWRDAVKGMGLPPRTGWHLLRHYHASLLIAAGLSPRAVADRLGHADVTETLKTYSHLWPTDTTRAVAAVEAELGEVFRGSDGQETVTEQ